nr:MAG TPA: hypothetical protein [Caudoviricetes sp.]DAY58122.1 MAG TPA: hypothetical protein [Caudoviricetes sp.]
MAHHSGMQMNLYQEGYIGIILATLTCHLLIVIIMES